MHLSSLGGSTLRIGIVCALCKLPIGGTEVKPTFTHKVKFTFTSGIVASSVPDWFEIQRYDVISQS